MGIYDAKIKELRAAISRAQAQITALQKEIGELRDISGKSQKADKQIADSLNKIYSGIRQRGDGVSEEFMNAYLSRIKEIAQKNNLNNVTQKTQEDNRGIRRKIEDRNGKIRNLRNQIAGYEQQLAHYKANNTEPKTEGGEQA